MAGEVELSTIAFAAATLLTIDSGVITITQSKHTLAAESGVTDELATITIDININPGYEGIVVLQADTGDTITLKHGTGNIDLTSGMDFILYSDDLIELYYDGTNWRDTQSSGLYDSAPTGATLAVGAEGGSDDINVTVQLTNRNGAALAVRGAVHFYLADDANGDTPSAVAPDGGIAIGTDGALIEWVADLSGMLISEADGDIDITLTDSGTPTFYLVVVLPTGLLAASAAITFA